jgi:hypothetical protein
MVLKLLEKQMKEQLAKYNDKKILVFYVSDGEISTETGKLEYSDNGKMSRDVDLSKGKGNEWKVHKPVLGEGCAVQMILSEDGSVLYENPLVDESYTENSKEIRKECGFD